MPATGAEAASQSPKAALQDGAIRPAPTAKQAPLRHTMTASYLLALLAACLVGFAGVCGYLFAVGKIPFWMADGCSLYLSDFIWEGQAIRDFFAGLAAGQGPSFPLYTYHLGYGADIPTSMGGMLNDPFNLISALVPQGFAVHAFVALVFVRLYLAAVSFSFYCLRRGNSREASMVAALVYAFCGFVLFWGVLRHPHFLNMAILLPLVASGADDVFERGRSPLLAVSMALQFLVSFYFGYMTCLMLLAYCLVKYFACPRQRSIGDFAVLVWKFVFHLSAGFCAAAVSAVPIVLNLASLGRVGQETFVPLLYEFAYYAVFPAELIGGLVGTRGVYMGAVGVVLAFAFLASRAHIERSQWRAWVCGFAIVGAMAIVPYAGHVMNGFGYPTDRWMLALAFVVAYASCLVVPVLRQLTRSQRRGIAVACLMLGAMAAVSMTSKYRVGVAAMTAFFAVAAFLVLRAAPRMQAKGACALLAALVLAGAAGTATFELLPSVGGYAEEHVSADDAMRGVLAYDPILAVEDAMEADGAALVRSTQSSVRASVKNAGLNSTAMPIDFYSSFYNQAVDDFRAELGIADHFYNYRFAGSDSRLALDLLTGARYYVSRPADRWQVPYAYEPTGIQRGSYAVHATEHALPLAFTVEQGIARPDYEALGMVRRQEALLQGAVLDEAAFYQYGLSRVEPDTTSAMVPFEVECEDGIVYEEGSFTVEDPGVHATITLQGQPDSETYLVMRNLGFQAANPHGDASPDGLLARMRDFMHKMAWREPTRSYIYLQVGQDNKSFEMGAPRAVGFGGKVDWASNLAYSKDGLTSFQISFEEAGTYTFDEMFIVCQPVQPLVQKADALAAGAARNLRLECNQMSATFDSSNDASLAFFSFAYSPGWTATVDGQPAEVVKANTGFLAVPLSGAGEHEVVLRYCTPGLMQGAVLSVVGLAALIALAIHSRRRG